MDTRLDILEHEVIEIKVELAAVKASCAWASDCAEIQLKIARIESTLMRMEKDIEYLKQSVKALEQDMTSIHKEIAQIYMKIEELRAENVELRTRLDQIDKRLTHIEETMVTKTELYAALDRFRVELYKHETKRTQWMIASVVTVVTFQVALTAYLAKLI